MNDPLSFLSLRSDLHVFDPTFHEEAYRATIEYRKRSFSANSNPIEAIVTEEYGELSRLLDRSEIQGSVAVRNILRVRALAYLLISDEGDIHSHLLPELIECFKDHLYSLGPQRQYDGCRQEHILGVLLALRDNKDYILHLKKISKPYGSKNADQIIRDTLKLPENVAITDAHTRRAVLSAWFTYLRQNVGSCFATAPAILIHDAQGHAFLEDLSELLSSGRLKRTFGGIEYSAPMSASWGIGDLRKPCFVPRSERFDQNYLWLSPGLLEAFTETGILDVTLKPKSRALTLKTLLDSIFKTWEGNEIYLVVTAEEIISRVFLRHLNLTKRDLNDYAQRPHEMIQGTLLVQMPKSATSSGGRGELCARYYLLFQQACNVFKQFTENALLKSWEYTLASFAETKPTFSSWNFYSSLGLNPEDKGGLGPCIYKAVHDQLEELNAQVKVYQEQYEQIYGQIRYLEVRIRSVNSETEGQWLQAELRGLLGEFRSVQEMRDKTHTQAQNMSALYSLLVEIYEALFPRYFQEVYDADIHEVVNSPYDDSPAGFRLYYKYGRSNTSQWTAIYTANEFVEALVSFFVSTEVEIASSPHFEELRDILGRIVSTLVQHVRTQEFLESALRRMAAIHKTPLIANPLENMDRVSKKPWVYTSGGSMQALVSCYFGLLQPPASVSRWVESPIELLVFLLDTIKQMPSKDLAALARSRKPALLMHSPTHAFLFNPTHRLFQELVQSDAFTYTWVRDTIVIPAQRFIDNIVLDEAKMDYLIQLLKQKVSINFQPRFQEVFRRTYGTMSPTEFRRYILDMMIQDKGLRSNQYLVLAPEEIDALLYSQLPLISHFQVEDHIKQILDNLSGISSSIQQQCLEILRSRLGSYEQTVIGSIGLQNIVKGLLCLALKSSTSSQDFHLQITTVVQKLGLALPAPILFADTNWAHDYFGFLVNPGTGQFELWKLDPHGSQGSPMGAWKCWLDGSRKEPPWGVYINPHEYLR